VGGEELVVDRIAQLVAIDPKQNVTRPEACSIAGAPGLDGVDHTAPRQAFVAPLPGLNVAELDPGYQVAGRANRLKTGGSHDEEGLLPGIDGTPNCRTFSSYMSIEGGCVRRACESFVFNPVICGGASAGQSSTRRVA